MERTCRQRHGGRSKVQFINLGCTEVSSTEVGTSKVLVTSLRMKRTHLQINFSPEKPKSHGHKRSPSYLEVQKIGLLKYHEEVAIILVHRSIALCNCFSFVAFKQIQSYLNQLEVSLTKTSF